MDYIDNGIVNLAIKDKLFHSDKLEVRKSSLQGYGVFTKEDIDEGELLEECHHIEVPDDAIVERYMFNWPRGDYEFEKYVLSLGYGSIYNGSSMGEENVSWKTDMENDILVFYAIKNIKKESELLLYYDYEF